MIPILYFALAAAILFLGLRLLFGDRVTGRSGGSGVAHVPVVALGWALSLFLALTYVICVLFDLIFPDFAMNGIWSGLLPGFVWLTPVGFIIGLVESFLYGWYAALVFGGLFNAFAGRRGAA